MITTPPTQLDLQSAGEAQSSPNSAYSNHNLMLESRLGDECTSSVSPSASVSTSTGAQQNLGPKPESATKTATTTTTTTTSLSSSRQKIATTTPTTSPIIPKLIEKSVIIHKDENGFGLRIKGQAPVYIEHVHEGGAAWRAGVRALDSICKVNGVSVKQLDHKDVVLMFKSCSRFVALTLISQEHLVGLTNKNIYSSDQTASMISDLLSSSHHHYNQQNQSQYSIYNHRQPDQDRWWLASAPGAAEATTPDSASLFGPTNDGSSPFDTNSSVSQLTSSLLFVDRTKSFKSALNASSQSVASDQIRHLALKHLQHQRLGRVTSSSELDSSSSTPSMTRGASKLNRRDSSDDSTTGNKLTSGDKRLAICASCHQKQQQQQHFETDNNGSETVGTTTCSQCKLKLTSGGQMAYKDQSIQRQLQMSLRDARMDPKLAGQHRHQLESSASDQNLATKDKTSRGGATKGGKLAVASPLVSMTAESQPLIKSGGGGSPPGKITSELQAQPQAAAKPKVVVNKRVEIIREFIETERTHTERLRCLDELFYRPLKQANFMNGEQLRMVFSCHRTLYKIHRQIYRILLSANYDFYSEPLIGSALLEIFEGDLKRRLERASCSFCSAQATNIELLNKFTRRDTKVGEFLAQVTSQRMIGRLGIKDLLASCFQRLTKYPLLLENLLKATPQTVPSDDDDDDDDDGDDDDGDNDDGGGRDGNDSGKRASQINRLRSLNSPRLAAPGWRLANKGQNSVSDDECGGGGGPGESDYDGYDDEDDASSRGHHHGQQLAAARRRALLGAAEEARLNARRMLAISLAEEREFIERALYQSRQILFKVNEAIRVAVSRLRLKEIWKRTDKYPGVPLIDITKQQVIHEGLLTLRLSKRSFDVYVLLLNDYIIILTREGQDKYRLKFFTPEGKTASASASSSAAAALSLSVGGIGSGSSGGSGGPGQGGSGGGGTTATSSATNSATNVALLSNLTTPHQTVYSPVFVIDEHLTTRDAATDENGFYLLCKRKDDSRIYEFASRSPVERMKWRDKIQWAIERQMSRQHAANSSSGGSTTTTGSRRPSCGSILTKSSSEISASLAGDADSQTVATTAAASASCSADLDDKSASVATAATRAGPKSGGTGAAESALSSSSYSSQQCSLTAPGGSGGGSGGEPTKIVGTISYVIDDGIVMPSKMESSRVLVDQAIQVNILDGTTIKAGNGDESAPGAAAGLKSAPS